MSGGEAAVSKADLIQEIRRLHFAERVELLEELWNEIESERPELFEWQKTLIDPRLKTLRRIPRTGSPGMRRSSVSNGSSEPLM